MKTKSLVLVAALVGSFFSASAFAITLTPQPAVKFEAPAPSKVTPVQIPMRHEGDIVTLSMTVGANGKPRNVRVLNQSDQSEYKHLLAAVAKWEFAPARKDGKAVSSRIELPLEVIDAKNG
jgi:TonB family protein